MARWLTSYRPELTSIMAYKMAVLLSGRWRSATLAGGFAREVRGDGGRVGCRVGGKQHRRPRCLVKVEVLDHVPEDGLILAHVRSRVRAVVGLGIEPGPAEEMLSYEFQVGIAAECLVVDESLFGVGGNDDCRHAQA